MLKQRQPKPIGMAGRLSQSNYLARRHAFGAGGPRFAEPCLLSQCDRAGIGVKRLETRPPARGCVAARI